MLMFSTGNNDNDDNVFWFNFFVSLLRFTLNFYQKKDTFIKKKNITLEKNKERRNGKFTIL